MNSKVLGMAAVAVVAVAVVAVVVLGSADDTDDRLMPAEVVGMPDTYVFDDGDGTIDAGKPVDWKIFDLYHGYCNDKADEKYPLYSKYTGYEIKDTQTIQLSPGKYAITAEDTEFTVFLDGYVKKTLSWTYDMDGVKHDVSADTKFTVYEFISDCEANKAFNKAASEEVPMADKTMEKHGYMFYDLPKLAVVDRAIEDLASSIKDAYRGIGGSVNDRQGYADFIASAVQLTVEYPPSVPGEQYDYYIWGCDEYWGVPLETLYYMVGDCEDTSALLCALYEASGFDAAMGGKVGHVFVGVHIDDFSEVDRSRLNDLGVGSGYRLSHTHAIEKLDCKGKDVYYPDVPADQEKYYYAVETIEDQIPVGYLNNGDSGLNEYTKLWGWAGFYTKDTVVFPEEQES